MSEVSGFGGGGGAPRGRLGLNHARMCVFKSEGNGFFFRLQVNDMNEKMSFKIGVKFAALFDMGKKGVIRNWNVFKSWTHTSGHFDIEVAPPPPTPRGGCPISLIPFSQSLGHCYQSACGHYLLT